MAGGLEQGSWGLGRVSKGLGGWGLERAEGLGPGGGLDPQGTSGRTFARTFARTFVRSFGRMDGKFTPLSYRTSSPSGPLPKSEYRPTDRLRHIVPSVSPAALRQLLLPLPVGLTA